MLRSLFAKKSFGTIVRPNHLTKEFEKDRAQFKQEMKEIRKKYRQEYWEMQAQVEDEWLNQYDQDFKEKMIRDRTKENTSVIRNAFKCYTNIVVG